MRLNNRNIILLLDILCILKLRFNFLLKQKIYEKSFKILFDTTKLYFKHKTSSKKIIQVCLTNRIYIIINITLNHKDITFLIIIATNFNKVIFLPLVLH
jgi:hypothetical protein